MARFALPAFIAGALLLALASSASAAELKTPLQTCTDPDCGATLLDGRINKSERCCGFANLPLPWVAQLYADKKECLRLSVTSPKTGTAIVAVAPRTERAWRNSASKTAPCPTCSLLKIVTKSDEAGWFLVQVNQVDGVPEDKEFTLSYARYAADNPNCDKPTKPLPSP